MTDPIDVQLSNVTKHFGTFTAVQNVSLSVPRGAFFSILGPSGCGKTTLLKLISGFEEPTAGDIFIAGKHMNGVPPNRRKANMVFQRLALFPLMSVFDNVAFGLKMARVPKAQINVQVEQILETVGLSGFGQRMPGQLSGGQQQRVAIARCLVLEPEVVLLDEPLSALDLKLREQMKLQLKHLQNQIGTTFVYITHDQSEAMVMSDRIAVMHEGQVLQVGQPDEIYSRPTNPFVASFVGESNSFQGVVTDRIDSYAYLQAEGLSLRVTPRPDMQVGRSYLQFLRPEKVYILPLSGESNLDNLHPGIVNDVIFDGAIVRCLVDIGYSKSITVLLTRGAYTALPYKGEPVQIGWHATDVICFPALHSEQMRQLQHAQLAEV